MYIKFLIELKTNNTTDYKYIKHFLNLFRLNTNNSYICENHNI